MTVVSTANRTQVAALAAGLLASTLVACGSPDRFAVDDYPRLGDAYADGSAGVFTCAPVPAGRGERLLATHAQTAASEPLPDDISFVDVVGSSPAGWSFEPVAIVGDALPLGWALSETAVDDRGYEIVPFPFTPDGTRDFALGVIVDVPAQSESNPPAAIELSGATYTTGGETYVLKFVRQSFVSRLDQVDPQFCAQAEEAAGTPDDVSV